MNNYSIFEFGNNMLTKDNYTIKVNGSLTVKENEIERSYDFVSRFAEKWAYYFA